MQFAFLVFLSAGYDHGKGSVGLTALASANGNASLSGLQALIHGVLANVLVCCDLALLQRTHDDRQDFWRSSFPIAAFSAAGFEHSIANMYLLTFALLTKFWAATTFWARLGRSHPGFPHLTVFGALINLVGVTIGNMIGGVVVGITYWFIYLRKPESGTGGRER